MSRKTLCGLTAGSLVLLGCQARQPASAPMETLRAQELVASFGHTLAVRYESQRAYELVQKALYWRGRTDPVFAHEGISEAKRISFLLSIDAQVEFRSDADIYITEAEAADAWRREYQIAQRTEMAALPHAAIGREASGGVPVVR